MSEKPPPLPGLENLESPVKTVEVRMAPPHAPLLWRTLAFLVDFSVFGMLGWFIATQLLIPQNKPDELAVFHGWREEVSHLFQQVIIAAESGDRSRIQSADLMFLEKLRDMPAGVRELFLYLSNCMTVTYWLGFAGMEIATRGASLGKKMFRLRTASFPYCGRPGILDSVIRSGWKAMSFAPASPLIWLFAILDAHWPLFNPLRRSLHDVLCRTVVLDARFDPPEPPRDDEEDDE